MTTWRSLVVVACIALAGLSLGGVAHALQASALVLEKSGASTPEVQPYSEIQVGKVIALMANAKLVFLHYATCQTVAVVGGTVTFSEQTYEVKGGVKEIIPGGQCPHKVRLKARNGPQVGGILLRKMPRLSAKPVDPLTLPTRPVLVLAGEHIADFDSLRVFRGDTVVLTAPIEGPSFRWPAEAAALVPGDEYELALVPKTSSETAMIKLKFTVRSPSDDIKDDKLVVLTID